MGTNETRNHRALYKRNSISRSPQEMVQRQMAINESLRRKHREQLITAKRFRYLTRREEEESMSETELEDERVEHDEDIDPYYRLNKEQVAELAQDLRSGDREVRLEAANYVGKFVIEPAQALIDYIVEGDCMERLVRMISGTDHEEQVQAAQTISNFAAGPYSLWKKSVSALPYLISLLDSENSIREIAASALGNMAAEDLGELSNEDDEVRARIRNNGAVPPLARMLDSKDPRVVQSACFALANLARGQDRQLQEYTTNNIPSKLLDHLADETTDTITEVCWVMSYLTAANEGFRQQVIHGDFCGPLVSNLVKHSEQGVAVLPILRILGNLTGGSDEAIQILLQYDDFLMTVIKLTHSEHRAIKKESLWVLSNITATKRQDVIDKLIDNGLVSSLVDLVQHAAYDIRKGSAYCVMNIASHGEKYTESLPHEQLLPGFLDLIRSQDAELTRLGLDYIDMLLNHTSKGKAILDKFPTFTEALGAVNPLPDPDLYGFANRLADQYYDETPNMKE